MQNQFDENKKSESASEQTENFAFENVMTNKKTRRTWSVLALLFAVLSLIFFWISWLGLVFGVLAVSFALLSRRELTYFDGLTLASILIGIFGIVFAIAGLIFGDFLASIGLPM